MDLDRESRLLVTLFQSMERVAQIEEQKIISDSGQLIREKEIMYIPLWMVGSRCVWKKKIFDEFFHGSYNFICIDFFFILSLLGCMG